MFSKYTIQDLDVLANELHRMGRLPNNPPSGSISPPPPAPPTRNTSILIGGHSNGVDKHHHPIDDIHLSEPASAPANLYQAGDGTLRGGPPTKPLPPTPDDDEPNDGTLMIHRKHSRSNGSQSNIRRNNSGSIVDLPSAVNGAHNRLSIVGKAASVPDVNHSFIYQNMFLKLGLF
jgi:hypothetical protein